MRKRDSVGDGVRAAFGIRSIDGERSARTGRSFLERSRRWAAIGIIATTVSAYLAVAPPTVTSPAAAVQSPTACNAGVALLNGGFEQPVTPVNSSRILSQAQVPGWSTTAADGAIEIWHDIHRGVPASSGSQHAELNANLVSQLYQDVATTPGQTLRWSLDHRGRAGVDTMRVLIGSPAGPLVNQATISDGNTAWGSYAQQYTVPAGQTVTRFGFDSVSAAGGDNSVGNFLDNISFGTGACVVTTQTVTTPTGGATANIGDVLTYSITAASGGGIPADLSVITDQLPAGVTFIPGSIRSRVGATSVTPTDALADDVGEYNPATRTVTVRVGGDASATAGGDIPPGESRTISYQVRVDAASAGSVITDDSTTAFTDGLSGNRLTSTSNPATVSVNPAADLAVTQAQLTAVPVAGLPLSHAITTTNNGPNTQTNAIVVTRLTSNGVSALDPAATAVTDGGTCVVSTTAITCTYASIAPGESRTATIQGTVPADVPAGTQFTLSSDARGDLFDPAVLNNSASLTDSVTASADLGITLTSSPENPTAGTDVTYVASVTNDGPSTARGIMVTNPIATGDTFVSATTPGGTCTFVEANRTVECEVPDLAPGGSTTVTVVVNLDPAGEGVVTSSVIVSGTVSDPAAGNNTASVSVNETALANVIVDLTIDQLVAQPGDTVGYTLLVTNAGPSVAQNVAFNTVVPPGFSVIRPDSPFCTPTSCTLPSLGVGQTVTIIGTVEISPDAEEGPGRASTTAISSTPESNPDDNTDSVDFEIVLEADLRVSQVIDNADAPGTPIVAGGRILSVITVENLGPTRSESLVQRQTYSAGQAVPTVTTNRGSCVFQGQVENGVAVDGGVLECTLDVLESGGTWTISLVTVLRANYAEDTFTRDRTVSSASPDPDLSNNTVSTTVPVVRQSDIAVAVTTDTPTVVQTGTVRFQVVVTNNGPSDARDIVIQESPQPGLVLTGATPSAGTYDQSTGAWTIPSLPVGASVTLDLVGTAEDSGSVTNTAAFASAESTDTNPANDSGSSTIAVTPAAQSLTIAPTATVAAPGDQNAVRVGDSITYSYTVTNTGNVEMTGIVVTDALVGVAICPQSALAAGEAMVCTASGPYIVTQEDFDAGSTVNNSATVQGDPAGPTGVLTFGPEAAPVQVAAAQPAIEALLIADFNDADGDNAIDVGETIGYTVRVTNTGDVTLSGVTISDLIAGDYDCPDVVLAPGQSTNCVAPLYVITPADVIAGQVDNTATATGTNPRDGSDIVSAPSSTTTPTDPAPAITIVTTGTVAPAENQASARFGDVITWTYEVTNVGNVAVTDLVIADPEGGDIVCDVTSLQPGESATCTGSQRYVVGEADVLAGQVANTASASATPVTGVTAIGSGDSTAVVEVEPAAAALVIDPTVVNTTRPGAVPVPGDLLAGVYVLRNDGNVTLIDVSVTDPLFGDFECEQTTLAPGAETTCRSLTAYRVTDEDVAAGSVNGSPSAVGTPQAGSGVAGVTATAAVVVPVQAAPLVLPAPPAPPAAPAAPIATPPTGRGGSALGSTGTDPSEEFALAALLVLLGCAVVGRRRLQRAE